MVGGERGMENCPHHDTLPKVQDCCLTISNPLFDNILPIPDAEPLPFYSLVLKLVVFAHFRQIHDIFRHGKVTDSLMM